MTEVQTCALPISLAPSPGAEQGAMELDELGNEHLVPEIHELGVYINIIRQDPSLPSVEIAEIRGRRELRRVAMLAL